MLYRSLLDSCTALHECIKARSASGMSFRNFAMNTSISSGRSSSWTIIPAHGRVKCTVAMQ